MGSEKGKLFVGGRVAERDRQEAPHRSKKNTRKWCRGKPGREHKPHWVRDARRYSEVYVFKCDDCGKELETCWKFCRVCVCGMHGKPSPTPARGDAE